MMLRLTVLRKALQCSGAFDWHHCHSKNKIQLDCVFGWASCHVWVSCKWLRSQTDQFGPDGSVGSSVGRETQK